MACLNMIDNDQGFYSTARISFSNDFADSQQSFKLENGYRQAPVSSDFEFSVPIYPMISADELFFKGKILPLKENITRTPTTLRDELLAGDADNYEVALPRLAKRTSRWKEKLGLKRSHSIPPKKAGKNAANGTLESIDEMKTPHLVGDDVFVKSKGDRIAFWT